MKQGQKRGKIKIAKVNIDENQAVASQLRVQSIPAVFAFVDGQPVDGFMGAQSASTVKEVLNKLEKKFGKKSLDEDDYISNLDMRFKDEKFEDSLENFKKALEKDKNNPEIHSMIINCYVALGQVGEAKLHLAKVPSDLKVNQKLLRLLRKLTYLIILRNWKDMKHLETS